MSVKTNANNKEVILKRCYQKIVLEQYGKCKRSELPYGKEADDYWKKHIDALMAEVEFYEYELELGTKYRPKGVTEYQEAFTFMDKLIPSKENAFLFTK